MIELSWLQKNTIKVPKDPQKPTEKQRPKVSRNRFYGLSKDMVQKLKFFEKLENQDNQSKLNQFGTQVEMFREKFFGRKSI